MEIQNLSEYELVELETSEIKNINGGILYEVLASIAITSYYEFKAGFEEGYNDAVN